jgi:hypothetical protein
VRTPVNIGAQGPARRGLDLDHRVLSRAHGGKRREAGNSWPVRSRLFGSPWRNIRSGYRLRPLESS